MLSWLNTLVGFAALFALLSLVVTTGVQLLRTALGFGSRRLAETLLRLFGEIEDPRRFVAAILSHPSLTGPNGYDRYKALVDPNEKGARRIVDEVLDAHRRLRPRIAFRRSIGTWPAADLDKQTVKDIASTVYARIGPLVDPFPDSTDPLDAEVLERWGTNLKKSVAALPAVASAGGSGKAAAEPLVTAAVVPHLGRLWLLATAAFPEGEGKANPIKTYIAAFYDESAASASDTLTIRIRRYTAAVAFLLALLLQLDAIGIWNQFSGMDPQVVVQFTSQVEALGAQAAAPNASAAQPPSRDEQVQKLQKQIKEVKSVPLDLAPRAFWKLEYYTWPHLFGLLLAWVALSLGAPFWFEILKSGINMKSAFTQDKKTT